MFLLDHLGLQQDLIEALVNYGDFDIEESAEAVAFVSDEEWEDLIANVTIHDVKLKIGQKSKVRRLLIGARLMAGETGDEADVQIGDGEPAA